ncbi:MAG: SAM-dependent methyltransferase [Elusimicrobia bacterium]|nr:SAM-dependent methyltransferase [Elusimicrobiota bacterium]
MGTLERAKTASHPCPPPSAEGKGLRTFRDFCETALYHPERGFYSRRRPAEHFYTAPELHPAFGWALSRALARWLDGLRSRSVPPPYTVVEMGSGAGLLAHQLREGLRRERPDLEAELCWVLVERSRARLLESLAGFEDMPGRVLGCERLNEAPVFRGVFLSNELVDALPFHVLEKRRGRVQELYTDGSGAAVLGALSTRALEPHAQALAASLEEGQRHAVCLEARPWLGQVAQRMECGYLATIDYGKRFGPGDVNAPRSYRRHTIDDRILADPGTRDLTAPVDFSALITEGEKLGLACASFTSMARFLLDCGLLDWLPAGSDAATVTERARLKTLVHPEGMGEAFKVLVQTKRVCSC